MARLTSKLSWTRFIGIAAGCMLGSAPAISAGALNEDGVAGFFRLQSAELPEYTRLGLSFYNRILNMNTDADGFNTLLKDKRITLPNGTVQPANLFAADHELAASIASLRFIEAHVAVPLYNQDLYYQVNETRTFAVGDIRYGLKLAMPIGTRHSPLAAAVVFGGSMPTADIGSLPVPRRLEYNPNDTGLNRNGSPFAGTGRDDWHIGGAITLDLEHSAIQQPIQFHVNAGSRKTSALTPSDRQFFDVFTTGAGFEGHLSQYASLLGEYWHEDRLEQSATAVNPKLDEISLGLAFHTPIGVSAIIGAGFALYNTETTPVAFYDANGVHQYDYNLRTSPDVQLILALTYTSRGPQDRDGDGIMDKVDKCPDDPEDKDHFEDEDGCPDADNDKDGICDPWVGSSQAAKYAALCKLSDKCPNEPEDKDGFEDDDGCPDADNDKDTLCDPWVMGQDLLSKYASLCRPTDKCPNEAGPEKFQGCPVRDRDGDGITDEKDKCPDDPEDKDGFQDEDGCPDPDNDKDGICDPWIAEKGEAGKYSAVCRLTDKCPNDPEDIDQFEDDDGCPDPDNDKDGICDPWIELKGETGKYAAVCKPSDKCPDKPETMNGFQDEDGCPDVAPVQQKTLVLRGVNFETNKATLLPESYPVLDDIANQLNAAPEIEVEVSGHTDNRSGYEYNMALSRNRAQTVASYLISKGVATNRLKVAGYGFTKPIASNRTADGRLQNRRVEFNRLK